MADNDPSSWKKIGEVYDRYITDGNQLSLPVDQEHRPLWMRLDTLEHNVPCGAPEDPCRDCQERSDERKAIMEYEASQQRLWSKDDLLEYKVIDPVTGGAKGKKGWTFDDMPADALITLAKVYAMGAEKYGRANYKLGYAWSLTFSAMQRHLWLFWAGEDDDPESGLPHLAHACWHALTLLHFLQQVKGTDDR